MTPDPGCPVVEPVRSAGLTQAQAQERLRIDGPNDLPQPRRRSSLRRFGDQLVHFFALMLWAAAVLAFVGGLPQLGVAICVVVVVNAVFSFVQETRAGRAAERLRSLLPRRVAVRRDGMLQQVDAAQIVVGDLLVLEPGDRIPADAEVTDAQGLLVDTSMLTGESDALHVSTGDGLFAGTFVIEGTSEAVVRATGGATRLAGIARLTTEGEAPSSPLTLELQRVVRTIAVIAVSVGSCFFALSVALGNPPSKGFMFAIGVTVALVPEALLPTVTLSLAWAAEQLAKKQVLVRNLEAVETLGSTTFICTDKTGTLTRNQMTVVQAWTPAGGATVAEPGYDPTAAVVLDDPAGRSDLEQLAWGGVRCSTGFVARDGDDWTPRGDPMEAAIDAFARRLGLDSDGDRVVRRVDARFPFDPRRRRMSVVVDGEVLVKGAPDSILPLCSNGDAATDVLGHMTRRGLRVLAVASRPVVGELPGTSDSAETGLRLVGLLALQDPPRNDVQESIEACRRAGIKVAMITGDHPATAAAIADEVGLRAADAPVLTGQDLPVDLAELASLVDHDGIVLARISPEDKVRIARALRSIGHVVAMTGDGVNDGPALHEADIGIAMGRSGTDVAREASDLVLLDDHFASIVAGVEQGRATFLNVRRFLTYHLTDNVAELTPFVVWALSGGRFPLALGVMQILALDIGTDTLSAVALGAEPPAPHTLDRPPVSGHLLDRTVLRRAFGVLGPTEAAMSMLAFLVTFLASGWRPGQSFPEGDVLASASGAAFMAVVVGQVANAYACRSSTRWPGALGWTTNRLLLPAVAGGLAVSLLALLVPALARELGHAAPTAWGWVVVLLTGVAVLAVDAGSKLRRSIARGG